MTQHEYEKNDHEGHTAPEQETVAPGHETLFNQENSTAQDVGEEAVAEGDTVEKLKAELQDAKEHWLRAEAENQNLRNRHKKELDDTRQYAVQKFARDVVEAAENLHRGIDSLPKATQDEDPIITKMREGLESTERSFLQILERNGIKYEDPTGAPFDANKHQAMAEQSSEEHPPGTVLQSWTPTWTLNNRLLKPAMVVVTKTGDKKE